MRVITARKLLATPPDALWDILTGKFALKFDDGEVVETNARTVLYSSYAWNFHRDYPKTPLLKRHLVSEILNGKRIGSGTHLTLLGNCMWEVYETYKNDPSTGLEEIDLRDKLSEQVYRLTNLMYNRLSHLTEEYVTTLVLDDFLEVVMHPKVLEARAQLKPIQSSLDHVYEVANEILANGVDLPNNPISKAVRSKLVNSNQVNQCTAVRGFLTDTDSNIFPVPIYANYTTGIRSAHDSLIESRSAAKSLEFSKEPLQQAEYFSRRLQLMNQIVRNLHMGDCGTTEYQPWRVRPPIVENGVKVFGGDLHLLVGKNYLDPETNTLKEIKASDKHLIGKTLQLRSPILCAHPDPYGICSTCFGALSLSVPRRTNIGQMCCTSMTQKSSQLVLSVKHYDGSSVVDAIEIPPEYAAFIKVAPDKNSYVLNEKLKGKDLQLIITPASAPSITDIREAASIETLNITRVSEIKEIGIRDKQTGNVTSIQVNVDRRLASMTYQFMHYVREVGWGADDHGNYAIDLKDWDVSKPFLTLPLKHFNMSDHSKDIANMLESSIDQMRERDTNVSPSAFLVELFDLVNSKLDVNLAVLEVVMLGIMIISAKDDDYGLPKPWTDRGFGVMKATMTRRSLAPAMAFEGHKDVITDPTSFTHKNRPDSLLDAILMPEILNE